MKVLAVLVVIALGFHAEAKGLPGDSLFHIGSKWLTQDGKEIELKDLKGRPTVLSLVYLSCQYICPTVISEVQDVESKLDPKTKDKVQIILVSFDPEKDTPEVMQAYAKKRKLEPSRWKFITNKKEPKMRELTAALGFKYQKDSSGEFTHSFMIFVLDEDGVIKARVDGANRDHAPLVDAIKAMTSLKSQ